MESKNKNYNRREFLSRTELRLHWIPESFIWTRLMSIYEATVSG